MANIAKTYTFVNGQPADATQVNKNFDDIIVGVGDVATVVRGPAAATDNAVARFDAATGKLVQNSSVIISDVGNLFGAGNLSAAAIIGSQPSAANDSGRVTLGSFNAGADNLTLIIGAYPSATPASRYGSMQAQDTAGMRALSLQPDGGGVHIGGTSDPGTDNLLVDGSIQGAVHISIAASVSVPHATPTTIYTFANAGSAFWLASTDVGDVGDATNYGAFAIIHTDGATARIMQNLPGSFMSVSLSGLNLQVTQTSGATQPARLTLTRVA